MEKQKECPYCGEKILVGAKKCKHCGEWLSSPPSHLSTNVSSNATSDNDTEDTEAVWGCLKSLFNIALIVGLLFWAYKSNPSDEKIQTAILEDVCTCVAENTSTVVDLLSGEEDSVLGALAGMYVNSKESKDAIIQTFMKANDINIKRYWFFSLGSISNADNPDGTTVAIGAFGYVLPLVVWDDFKLIN
ncbi:MAG: hypothetical protein J5506_08570 [Prevotella sp.]|nr:hypothetical protein [Prevotella sp.]